MTAGHFSAFAGGARPAGRTARGVPLLGWAPAPGLPPIAVALWSESHAGDGVPTRGTHAHDFLLLLYVESGRHRIHVDGHDHLLTTGDAVVVAPGAVIPAGQQHTDAGTALWAVMFPVEALVPGAGGPLASWRAHPLLAPFAGSGGAHRLPVPPQARAAWLARITGLHTELHERRDGYGDAARAHLTLLLVELGRLGLDVRLDRDADPVLAGVFDVIERRFHEPISLDDVAGAVALTPGHLTTVVGRRTGRTVGQWITERRMREARRLLADTDLPVGEVAGRVGYRDPAYFTRRFRHAHGMTPGAWRREGQTVAWTALNTSPS